MSYELKDGAVFISDCHENEKRRFFWQFLCEIEKQKPSQLFLMGDIFDLFIGGVSASEDFASPYVKKLESLANKFEIYYFEGNHDFNLSSYFSNVKVFSLSSQPMLFKSPHGGVLLSHGDFCSGLGYKIYTKIIRNKSVLKALNFLNKHLNDAISKAILQNQYKKNLCKKISNFKTLISKKLWHYPLKDVKFIFEGHYHQDKSFNYKDLIYQNFSSFSCDKSYFVVQFNKNLKIVKKVFE